MHLRHSLGPPTVGAWDDVQELPQARNLHDEREFITFPQGLITFLMKSHEFDHQFDQILFTFGQKWFAGLPLR